MANKETYYWVDEGSTFGGGESSIKYGDPVPNIEKDERFEGFKKDGKISTEKVAGKRVISELEKLKAEHIILKNDKGELAKASIDEALKTSVQADLDRIAELEKSSGSKITQEILDLARATSVRGDLDRIAELEGSEAQGTLELIKESLAKIQQGDSKAEIWDAVKSVKDLFEGE